ncbi:MAG: phosphotransferase family protein [Gaiellaceae bacterium]
MRIAEDWLQVATRELALPLKRVRRVDEGWHCVVFELNGSWILRVPRDPQIEQLLQRETTFLEAVGPTLPVAVPRFRRLEASGHSAFVYEKIDGVRIDEALAGGADAEVLGADLGRFLAALHSFPPKHAAAAGAAASTLTAWIDEQRAFTDRCVCGVYPLLDVGERRRADTIFDTYFASLGDALELRLVHADLGPAHLLCSGGTLTGVIDWTHAQIGDPAFDLGWPLHGAVERFAAAVRASYEANGGAPSDALYERALACHRLGPWYEVLYGLDRGEERFVASGVEGVRARLPAGG